MREMPTLSLSGPGSATEPGLRAVGPSTLGLYARGGIFNPRSGVGLFSSFFAAGSHRPPWRFVPCRGPCACVHAGSWSGAGDRILARQGLHIGKSVGSAPQPCPVGAEPERLALSLSGPGSATEPGLRAGGPSTLGLYARGGIFNPRSGVGLFSSFFAAGSHRPPWRFVPCRGPGM